MKDKRIVVKYLFPAMLLLYALRHVAQGIDLWDGGYNYANFTYGGLQYMDAMWFFATWLANVTGSLIVRLPFGHTMLGMNVYTGLLQGAIALAAYLFCVRKLQLQPVIAAVGELLALSLCWAPSAVLYNYMTYGLLFVGASLLYRGLTEGRDRYLVLAGVALGLNVGVRFPNLMQAGLILAVWYDAFLQKDSLRTVCRKTGLCVAGYAGAVLALFGMLAGIYGADAYVQGIRNLLQISDTAPDYSARFLLFSIVETYIDSVTTYWMKRLLLVAVGTIALGAGARGRWKRAAQTAAILFCAAGMGFLIYRGYCTTDYQAYSSMFYPTIFWLLAGSLLALGQLVRKETVPEKKLQAFEMLLLLYITSVGSNNAMYSCINNLFLIAPWTLDLAVRTIRNKNNERYFGARVLLAGLGIVFCVQGIGFGLYFVCEGAAGARDTDYRITGIPVLAGMRTGAENGRELEALYGCLAERQLLRKRCILYGDIPGISYYMQLPPAMNVWSDLLSYGPERMRRDLEGVQRDLAAGQAPVVIVHTKYADAREGAEEYPPAMDPVTKEKLDVLYDFMHNNGYRRLADTQSTVFAVYVPET